MKLVERHSEVLKNLLNNSKVICTWWNFFSVINDFCIIESIVQDLETKKYYNIASGGINSAFYNDMVHVYELEDSEAQDEILRIHRQNNAHIRPQF